MRECLAGSLNQISGALGFDTSTIIHGLRRAEELLETNVVFAALYRQAEIDWGERNAN